MSFDTLRNPAALVILILTLGGFSLGMAEFTLMGLTQVIATDLKTSIVQIGNTASTYALGVVVGGPILALCGSRYPRQKFLSFLLVWCCLGNLASSFATTGEQLSAIRFFCGIPHGVYFGIAALIAMDVAPAHRQGLAIGAILSGIGVALLVAVPLNTYIAEIQDWRIIFRVVALVDLLVVLLLHDLVPTLTDTPATHGVHEWAIFKKPLVVWILAISATAIAGRLAIFTYTDPILLHVTHVSLQALPVVFACIGLGTTLGFLLGGHWADKDPHKTIGYSLLWMLLVVVAFTVFAQHKWSMYLGFFMLGTFTTIIPALQILVIRYAKGGETFASCLNHSALNIANATGPFLAGLLISSGHGWMSVTWVGMGMGSLALLLWLVGKRVWLPKYQAK